MKILILEDNHEKYQTIHEVVLKEVPKGIITRVDNLRDFLRRACKYPYDLIIVDLLVPQFPDSKEKDCTEDIIEELTQDDSPNLYTTTIALTQFSDLAMENYKPLNEKDIIAITYKPDCDIWKTTLKEKIVKSKPKKNYAFIIVCALEEEESAFKHLELELGDLQNISGMLCTEIKIKNQTGLIIRCSRMGLVQAAITATKAIEVFEPKIITMSGICAGIKDHTNIYDVIISEMCYQHDSGKWTKAGFQHEAYSIQLEHELKQKITQLIENEGFLREIRNNITYRNEELPKGHSTLSYKISLGTSSSGSAVIADEQQSNNISQQHRKLAIFEMESYAIYEAARVAACKPTFFSVKSVVDNGDSDKGDKYHRIACLLSASTIVGILKNIL